MNKEASVIKAMGKMSAPVLKALVDKLDSLGAGNVVPKIIRTSAESGLMDPALLRAGIGKKAPSVLPGGIPSISGRSRGSTFDKTIEIYKQLATSAAGGDKAATKKFHEFIDGLAASRARSEQETIANFTKANERLQHPAMLRQAEKKITEDEDKIKEISAQMPRLKELFARKLYLTARGETLYPNKLDQIEREIGDIVDSALGPGKGKSLNRLRDFDDAIKTRKAMLEDQRLLLSHGHNNTEHEAERFRNRTISRIEQNPIDSVTSRIKEDPFSLGSVSLLHRLAKGGGGEIDIPRGISVLDSLKDVDQGTLKSMPFYQKFYDKNIHHGGVNRNFYINSGIGNGVYGRLGVMAQIDSKKLNDLVFTPHIAKIDEKLRREVEDRVVQMGVENVKGVRILHNTANGEKLWRGEGSIDHSPMYETIIGPRNIPNGGAINPVSYYMNTDAVRMAYPGRFFGLTGGKPKIRVQDIPIDKSKYIYKSYATGQIPSAKSDILKSLSPPSDESPIFASAIPEASAQYAGIRLEKGGKDFFVSPLASLDEVDKVFKASANGLSAIRKPPTWSTHSPDFTQTAGRGIKSKENFFKVMEILETKIEPKKTLRGSPRKDWDVEELKNRSVKKYYTPDPKYNDGLLDKAFLSDDVAKNWRNVGIAGAGGASVLAGTGIGANSILNKQNPQINTPNHNYAGK